MRETDPSESPPHGRWPFAGREEQIERLTTALRARSGRGVVLAGGAGVGRTRLAAEAARAFGPVLRVVGTRCGAALPFSAFAGLRSPGGDHADPIRELTAALRRPGQERPVLVVDDAHLLDPESAALVHHLAVRREVRLVVTVRDGGPAPDAVVALWKDDLLRRLEVPPLAHDDLARVLERALGGHVEARAVRRLTAIAGGDLRMIGELVRAGTLAHRDGVWGWHRGPVVNGCVRELVANRLGEPEPAVWDALTYLAFGAPLAPGTLARLAGPETVERLEAEGLLTRTGGAPYAELIRAMCGPARAMRVRRTLADAEPHDALRAALWRLDGGLPADPEVLAEGCRTAIAALDVPLAVRLARAAADATAGTPPAAGADATAAGICTPERADATAVSTCTPEEADATAEAPAAACATVGEIATAILATPTGPVPATAPPGGVTGEPKYTLDIAVPGGSGDVLDPAVPGEPGDALDPATPGGSGDALDPATPGGSGDALDLAVPRGLRGEPVRRLRVEHERLTAAILAGDLAAEPRLGADSEWDVAGAAHCGQRARLHRLRGEVRRALAYGRDGAWRLPDGPAAFAGQCLGELAHAAGLLGDAATARRALAEAEDRRPPAFRPFESAVELAAPWVVAASGDQAAAVRCALAAAERADDAEVALFSLHSAVRLGAAEAVADRLRHLASEPGEILARTFARHAPTSDDGATSHSSAREGEALAPLRSRCSAARTSEDCATSRTGARDGEALSSLPARCPATRTSDDRPASHSVTGNGEALAPLPARCPARTSNDCATSRTDARDGEALASLPARCPATRTSDDCATSRTSARESGGEARYADIGASGDGAPRTSARASGGLAWLFSRHADACVRDDGAALQAAGREFELLGLTLYAAEAQAQAARAYRRAGEHRQAKAAATIGWTLGRRCEGARTPALAELTAPELTLRQLEIARLAAAGLSNRAIAERLTVSIRTVANHLCGAYERLGVNDRTGLARLLAGLERRVA